MPTAVLDTSGAAAAASDAQARLADLNLDWLPGTVTDVLIRVRRRLVTSSLPVDPAEPEDTSRPIIRAVVDLKRICVGWDVPAGPPDEAANGAIDVTAIVETGRINSELWGTAHACKMRFAPSDAAAVVGGPVGPTVLNATLDGTLIVYTLAPLPDDAKNAEFLLRFEGSIGANGQVRDASFDFEYRAGSVSFRVPVASGGDVIVTVGTTLGIRAANGGFSCDLTTGACTAGAQ
jgi:hypothetical protein